MSEKQKKFSKHFNFAPNVVFSVRAKNRNEANRQINEIVKNKKKKRSR